jgi:hypothetical protein
MKLEKGRPQDFEKAIEAIRCIVRKLNLTGTLQDLRIFLYVFAGQPKLHYDIKDSRIFSARSLTFSSSSLDWGTIIEISTTLSNPTI